jgi:hypothetical protein
VLHGNRDGAVDRVASTRGHNAPHCTGRASGDVAEGAPVAVRAVTVKGDRTEEKGGLVRSHA